MDNGDDVTGSNREPPSHGASAGGCPLTELMQLCATWAEHSEVEHLRGPEAGLVRVQGRAGGTGDRFNLGNASVTRATVAVRLTSSEPSVVPEVT